jgi:hypothetical protein
MRHRKFTAGIQGGDVAGCGMVQNQVGMRRTGVLVALAADDAEGCARIAAFVRDYGNWARPKVKTYDSLLGLEAEPDLYIRTIPKSLLRPSGVPFPIVMASVGEPFLVHSSVFEPACKKLSLSG